LITKVAENPLVAPAAGTDVISALFCHSLCCVSSSLACDQWQMPMYRQCWWRTCNSRMSNKYRWNRDECFRRVATPFHWCFWSILPMII